MDDLLSEEVKTKTKRPRYPRNVVISKRPK